MYNGDFIDKIKDFFLFNWLVAWKATTCGPNQVYETRTECPRTCMNPSGNYYCGVLKPVQACYCAPGYVLDSYGNCVNFSDCGCTSPDGTSTISVNWVIQHKNIGFLNHLFFCLLIAWSNNVYKLYNSSVL